MNLGDVVGQLMRDGLNPKTQGRIEHAVGEQGLGGAAGSPDLGALLGGLFGGGGQTTSGQAASGQGASGGSGGLGDVLGGLLGGSGASGAGSQGGQTASGQTGGLGDLLGGLGQMLGSDSGVGGMSKGQLGGLGALAGAILGGGGGATKGAVGGSAMAVLGALALSALKNWQAQSAGEAVSLTDTEVKQIAAPQTAELCLRGMIEAMKADGEVSHDEVQRLVGKLSEGGITADEQQFVQGQLDKPQDADGLIRDIPNPEVGIQVYAAALMAIAVDTPAERAFLQKLAAGAGLDRDAVARLHHMVGAPAA